MKFSVRTIVPVAIMTVVAALGIGGKRLAEQLGTDGWACRALQGQTEADERRSADLDELKRCVDKRASLKELIALDVIAGRLTLVEASRKVRALNQLDPENMTGPRCMNPNDSDEVICARQVIAWIEAHADGSTDQETVSRLQAELQTISEGSHRK